MKNIVKKLAIFLIRTYQLTLSPRFSHGACRYTPTCSQYALEAIEIHGVWKGCWLAFLRILRCNPFFKGGYDPVPPKKDKPCAPALQLNLTRTMHEQYFISCHFFFRGHGPF